MVVVPTIVYVELFTLVEYDVIVVVRVCIKTDVEVEKL
jgi:hypothetical protein